LSQLLTYKSAECLDQIVGPGEKRLEPRLPLLRDQILDVTYRMR